MPPFLETLISDLSWVRYTLPVLVSVIVSILGAVYIQERLFRKNNLYKSVDEAIKQLDALADCIQSVRQTHAVLSARMLVKFLYFIDGHYCLRYPTDRLATGLFTTIEESTNLDDDIEAISLRIVSIKETLYKNC